MCAGIGFCLMTRLTDIYTARRTSIKSMKLEQRVGFNTNLSGMRRHRPHDRRRDWAY